MTQWMQETPESIEPEKLIGIVTHYANAEGLENAPQEIKDWWNKIPRKTLVKAMREDEEAIFYAMSCLQSPLTAHEFYKAHVALPYGTMKRIMFLTALDIEMTLHPAHKKSLEAYDFAKLCMMRGAEMIAERAGLFTEEECKEFRTLVFEDMERL